MRTIDANTLSGSARDTAGSTSSFANVVRCLDAKRVADMSRLSAKALDDLWQRAMKNSPRAEGLRDNNATNQRIVKEIRARRNPISFGGAEFESSLGALSGVVARDRKTEFAA
jgi:hypothetical protein